MSEEAEFPEAFTHSLKISDTAKGVRFDVHVWATTKETAVQEAFALYDHAVATAVKMSIPMAPVEVKEK